jgi:cyclic di-GMP phosphodiesterase
MNDEKKVILVVDDTPENIDVLSGILNTTYKVKAALAGEKAIKIASKKVPDLILLDVMMPEMDGFEVCRLLKSNDATKHIPIIFVTGKTEQDEIDKGMDLGAVDFLSKPIDPNLLVEKVAKYI